MTWCCFRCLHNCSQMDTRFSKRGRKAEDNEANPKLLHAVEEDLAQECEEVPIHPKKKKLIKYSPRKTMSPTGALELAKLKEQTKMDRQKIEHLEERINYLEEAIKDLKADKDVLLAKIKEAPSTLTSSGKGRKTAPEPSSSSTSTSTSPSSDSSFLLSSEEEKKKKRKKSKKKTIKSKKHTESYSGSRSR
uniref:protein FAM133B-like isoform X2 n=1 Tax=Gasterosteus aculeatus aculeatus TaxID=481459 RepID=UPI001A988CDC|nr:protein FAM133B-like isoform X2 [Gasterosteus aculeatus aculeatus]